MNNTITQHQQNRRKFWPTDPEYITKAMKMTQAYKDEKKQLKEKLAEMNKDMEQSTPVFSPRFQVWKIISGLCSVFVMSQAV